MAMWSHAGRLDWWVLEPMYARLKNEVQHRATQQAQVSDSGA